MRPWCWIWIPPKICAWESCVGAKGDKVLVRSPFRFKVESYFSKEISYASRTVMIRIDEGLPSIFPMTHTLVACAHQLTAIPDTIAVLMDQLPAPTWAKSLGVLWSFGNATSKHKKTNTKMCNTRKLRGDTSAKKSHRVKDLSECTSTYTTCLQRNFHQQLSKTQRICLGLRVVHFIIYDKAKIVRHHAQDVGHCFNQVQYLSWAYATSC